jgi:hypothetical protein
MIPKKTHTRVKIYQIIKPARPGEEQVVERIPDAKAKITEVAGAPHSDEARQNLKAALAETSHLLRGLSHTEDGCLIAYVVLNGAPKKKPRSAKSRLK